MSKRIVLIVASSGFQEKEYHDTKVALEKADFDVIIASDKPATATDTKGHMIDVDLRVDALKTAQFDGIFLIGGGGALACLDNQDTHKVLNEMFALQKPYGAICISPRILARAGVLIGKKATCWNGDGKAAELFERYGVTFVKEAVVVDGMVVTADGPQSAAHFGRAIVRLFQET